MVTAIPADGYDEVLLQLAGQPVKFAARSGRPVARGAEVWVEVALSVVTRYRVAGPSEAFIVTGPGGHPGLR